MDVNNGRRKNQNSWTYIIKRQGVQRCFRSDIWRVNWDGGNKIIVMSLIEQQSVGKTSAKHELHDCSNRFCNSISCNHVLLAS